MEGGDDRLQGLYTRMGTAERRNRTIKSTMNRLNQAIERMSLNIDDRSLLDGTYRSGHSRQSKQPPPHRLSPHHPPPRYTLQRSQFIEFFYEKKLHSPIYHYDEDYEDRGMFYDRQKEVR